MWFVKQSETELLTSTKPNRKLTYRVIVLSRLQVRDIVVGSMANLSLFPEVTFTCDEDAIQRKELLPYVTM